MKSHSEYSLSELDQLYRLFSMTAPFKKLIRFFAGIALRITNKKVILVLGLSRSGTTMAGEFISFAPGCLYIHEPVKQIMRVRYNKNKDKRENFWNYCYNNKLISLRLHALVCTIIFYAFASPRNVHTIVIKPILLYDRIGNIGNQFRFLRVVYISRHPCGYIDSLIRQGQLDRQENQPPANELILKYSQNWAINIKRAQETFRFRSDWIWILFERVTSEPVLEFELLYKLLQLEWTEDARDKIKMLTTSGDGGFYETRRNAISQADKWKTSLPPEMISFIRDAVNKYSTNLYAGF